MLRPTWTTFPALSRLPGFAHRFTLRNPEIDVNAERDVVVKRLWTWHRSQVQELGFDPDSLCIAEQVHGNFVLTVNGPQTSPAPGEGSSKCSSLRSSCPGMPVGCCASTMRSAFMCIFLPSFVSSLEERPDAINRVKCPNHRRAGRHGLQALRNRGRRRHRPRRALRCYRSG